ncbi:serine/threonine-protein kinase Nek4-like isoform X1 [Dreissena polymorpha]|uniref:serine/threonine-protein kinase Nek4-like isoform X1 n=1 Tax=Dreissena polymorpha TaxID=45954 RepID=UPI002263FABA|nr:serine/threonine-protein kinase Nek4-like isoform X1 [Dreissena polymorpha]
MASDDGGYRVAGCIGKGAFGKVLLLENSAGDQVALKVVELAGKDLKIIELTIQEVCLLATLDHAHILKFLGNERDGLTLLIYTEYCPNGDLSGYVSKHRGEKMDERRLVEWVRQIASALEYLHNLPKPVIHRDLKSLNVFLDANWDTRLGDFGVSRVIESSTDMATTQVGTMMYMAPEMFSGLPYTEKTDIFSLSILMYEMATMDNDSFENMMEQKQFIMMIFRIVHYEVPTMPTGYSAGVTDLMKMMMQADPSKRPSADEILRQKIFKTTGKPPPITDPPKVFDIEDDHDEDTYLSSDTLTLINLSIDGGTSMGGKAKPVDEKKDAGAVGGNMIVDLLSANPIMGLVTRVLDDMGKTHLVKGRSKQEKNAELLKMYCLHCMDNNEELFKKASAALTASYDEDQIEVSETLIRILGHERYGLCGMQLLHYKNYTFAMKNM